VASAEKERAMNPLILDLMIAERSAEMRREVRRRRLLAQYDAQRLAARRAAWGRLWIALGDLLIRIGEGIKLRYKNRTEMVSNPPSDRFYPCP
jgi:hypothetical protein